jgi:hypothetical protein
VSNFTKICYWEPRWYMRTHGRTDMTEVIGSVREYANVPKSLSFRPMVYWHGCYGSQNNQQLFFQTTVTCGVVGPKMSGPSGDSDYRGTTMFSIHLADLQRWWKCIPPACRQASHLTNTLFMARFEVPAVVSRPVNPCRGRHYALSKRRQTLTPRQSITHRET